MIKYLDLYKQLNALNCDRPIKNKNKTTEVKNKSVKGLHTVYAHKFCFARHIINAKLSLGESEQHL